MSSERKIYQVLLHSKISAVPFSHSSAGTANSWSHMNAWAELPHVGSNLQPIDFKRRERENQGWQNKEYLMRKGHEKLWISCLLLFLKFITNHTAPTLYDMLNNMLTSYMLPLRCVLPILEFRSWTDSPVQSIRADELDLDQQTGGNGWSKNTTCSPCSPYVVTTLWIVLVQSWPVSPRPIE